MVLWTRCRCWSLVRVATAALVATLAHLVDERKCYFRHSLHVLGTFLLNRNFVFVARSRSW